MAVVLGEHTPGMTYRCTEFSLTALFALASALSLGCDAPEKTVGQETDGESTSDSASGSGSGSATDSGETDSGSETGGTVDCAGLETPGECAENDCEWLDTIRVSTDGETCTSEPGAGYCNRILPFGGGGDDCGDSLCAADSDVYWTREVATGEWEVLGGAGCSLGAPEGFTQCDFSGDDPAACECVCEGGSFLPEGFEPTLTGSGCGDMNVFASTPDGTIGLSLSTGFEFNPVDDAVSAGMSVTTTHDVSEFARLVIMVGTNVTYPECNDALDPDAYSIDQEWLATAGSVEITIQPVEDAPKFGTTGFATVTITGLEVSLGGITEMVNDVTFEDIGVGWLPG